MNSLRAFHSMSTGSRGGKKCCFLVQCWLVPLSKIPFLSFCSLIVLFCLVFFVKTRVATGLPSRVSPQSDIPVPTDVPK